MSDAKRRPCARRGTRTFARLVAFAAAFASAPLVLAQLPTVVKGRITGWERLMPQLIADAAKSDSHRFTWREPSPTVKQEFRRLSANPSRDVCIAALGGSPVAGPHEPVPAKVTGGRITPSTFVVPPGTRISFRNVDPFPHQLYVVGDDKWPAATTGPGSSREWAAGAPGVKQIRDQLFPSVVAYIVVDPAVVDFTYPDRDGTFSMPLPVGDYTLRAFFEGKPVGKEVPGVHLADRGLLEIREPIALGGDSK